VEELGYWSELDHCILTIMDVSYQWLGQDFLAPIQNYVDRPCHTMTKTIPFYKFIQNVYAFWKHVFI
jgi:hypothetical protein